VLYEKYQSHKEQIALLSTVHRYHDVNLLQYV